MTNPAAADEADAPVADAPAGATILVPWSLRAWFRVHCAVDLVAGLPLLLFPHRILGLLGWTRSIRSRRACAARRCWASAARRCSSSAMAWPATARCWGSR